MKWSIPLFLLLILGIAIGAFFAPQSADPELRRYACQLPGSDWQHSMYVLPYPVGNSYALSQANCSGGGHSNFWNHSYDFRMDVGTTISAARSGVVTRANDGCVDGDRMCTNLITVQHNDGTVALYSHLTKGGILVRPGQTVVAGQIIGRSGNTGHTGGLPHLHFSVHPCGELPGLPKAGACPSIPVNFRNTEANPTGLIGLQVYRAKPF